MGSQPSPEMSPREQHSQQPPCSSLGFSDDSGRTHLKTRGQDFLVNDIVNVGFKCVHPCTSVMLIGDQNPLLIRKDLGKVPGCPGLGCGSGILCNGGSGSEHV